MCVIVCVYVYFFFFFNKILAIFYSLKLEFLSNFLMPLIGALSVVIVYFLGKRLFNSKVGIYYCDAYNN
mgnify:CR=1 FL=1